jgi:hypothetical protein
MTNIHTPFVTLKELRRIPGEFVNSHKAHALFFACCDFRFRTGTHAFIDELSGREVDMYMFPGSVMLFIGEKYGHPNMREGTLYWANLLAEAHQVDRIYVELHGKHIGRCGAYALSPALQGKSSQEIFEHQMADAVEVKHLLEHATGKPVTLLYKEAAEDGSNDIIYHEIVLVPEGGN